MLLLRKSKMTLGLLMACLLLIGTISIGGKGADAAPVNKPIIGQVPLGAKSSIRVKNVQLTPSSDKQTLAFTIEIVNNENKSLMFYDYWTKVKLNNGVEVPVKLTNLNVNKSEIAPKSSAEYTYVGTVSRTTKYTDMIIQLIKWDFSVANYTKILGSVRIPASYDPINNSKNVFVDGTKLWVTYKNFKTYQLEDEKRIEFEVEFNNLGFRTVTIPKYKYNFITPDNYVYEITPVSNEDVKIQPKAKITLKMKLSIPNVVKVTTGNISIVINDEQTKLDIPLLSSAVKLASTTVEEKEETIALGTEKEFLLDEKKYAVRLDSVQQLPLESENIINSTVSIINKTSEALPIPDLLSVYYVDGVAVATDKVKQTQLTTGVGIPANGSVQVAIHTTTAYTASFSKVKLEFTSQLKTDGGETIKEKITTYEVPTTSFKSFSKVAVGGTTTLTTGSSSSAYKIHSLQAYKGTNNYLYNVLLEVQNKDVRSANLSKLVAYFKNGDSYYPVKISEVKDKIIPNGKVLLSLSTRIPTYMNTNELKIVLGELIDDNTYLAAAEFELPGVSQDSGEGNLQGLEIYPYKLNINSIIVDLDSNANINFKYELTKTTEYESVPDGHSIIMEVIDKNQSYTKEFKLESDLELGAHQQTMVAQMKIDNPNTKIMEMDGLEVNIYDQYEGYKKLLGSRMVYSIIIK